MQLLQNREVNWDPWSDTIFLGTPCRQTICAMYNSTSLAPEYVVYDGIKWATLVSLSTITQIESYQVDVPGRPMMKSMLISSHFH
jgi:hypothetical protein